MTYDPEDIKVGPSSSIVVVITTLCLGGGAAVFGMLAMVSHSNTPPADPLANLGHVLNCAYQTSTASMFGAVGAVLLCAAMAVISVLGGCVCCCTMTYAPGRSQNVSIVCFTFAWALFCVAEICLLTGGFINKYHGSYTNYMYDYQLRKCYGSKSSAYLIGSITSVACVLFAVLYYGQAQKAKYEAWVDHGAPTPRLFSAETNKSFVIAGPARSGPLQAEEDGEEDEEAGGFMEHEDEDDHEHGGDYLDDDFDETDSLTTPLHPGSNKHN